jgi:DNA polymerase-1
VIFGPEELELFPDWYSDINPILVGHNLLSYDIPVLNHLLGLQISWDSVVDTLVLSQLYDPKMPAPEGLHPLQKHSLEAWGVRLKQPKQEHDEWDKYSEQMLSRCRSDVLLNRSVYLALSRRLRDRGFSEKSCWIEHGAHVVIDEQMANGISFDIPKAEELLKCLRTEQDRLTEKIRKTFKPELTKFKDYKYRVKADGQPFASFLRHQELVSLQPTWRLRWKKDKTQYSLWREVEFNIASPPQRLKRLLELGYIPQKKTKKGNPSVDEESLLEFAKECGIEEVTEIAEWLVLFGRANAVENWLGLVDKTTGRLHGRVWSCGAANRRMTHTSPNTANIPKVKTKYGKECRALFRAPTGRVLVGIDAKSLQMRIFGHYLGDLETAKLYIEGDPHSVNSEIVSANPWGYRCDRDTGAKNGFYAFIFGAQDKKLGLTFDTSIVESRKATEYGAWGRRELMKNTPGLERLVKEVQREFNENQGFISTIDGGFVRCHSEHAAVNYKIASGEACLMKLVDIRTRERFQREGFEYLKVLDVHDEDQYETIPLLSEEIGRIGCEIIKECGEELGFIVPMAGAFTQGTNWSETH